MLLREHDAPHRVVPIFVGGPEAAAIAVAVTGQVAPRPLTHDLMASLVRSLDGHLDAVEVTGLADGAYQAQLRLRGANGLSQQLDTRPSDAIALAVRLGAPLFMSDELLDEVGSVPSSDEDGATTVAAVVFDDADIDDAVEQFRGFLDDVDPDDFDARTDDAG